MLREILINQRLEREKQINRILQKSEKECERIVLLKNQLDKLSDGLLILDIKEDCLMVSNIQTPVRINGTIDDLKISGLGLFKSMGERHTVESFFKKVAPYLIIKP